MLMPCRYETLELLINGLRQTGILLIQSSQNHITYIFENRPYGAVDDLGIYLFVPKLAVMWALHLETAIKIYFYAFFIFSLVCGGIGYLLNFYNSYAKLGIAVFSLACISFFLISTTFDAYSMCFFGPIAIIPFFSWLFWRGYKKLLWECSFFTAGIFLGLTHIARAFSGLGTIAWLIISSCFFAHVPRTKIALNLLFFFIGHSLPILFREKKIQEGKSYLFNLKAEASTLLPVHPFWHPFFLGFGFLNFKNKDNITWQDDYALNLAKTIKPQTDYSDPEYDSIIKERTFELIYNQMSFVIITLWAKLGVLLFYFLQWANAAILALFLAPLSINLPFIMGLIFSSLFSFIALPVTVYTIGFITMTNLWATHALCSFLDNSRPSIKNKLLISLAYLVTTAYISGLLHFAGRNLFRLLNLR